MNGDSFSAQPMDEREEEEEDFLDPNSAFVSVAVSKNKRSCNTTAISHMDRSQRTSNARKPPVSESVFCAECKHISEPSGLAWQQCIDPHLDGAWFQSQPGQWLLRRRFSWLSSGLPGKCWSSTLVRHRPSFHIISSLLFIYHLTIQCHIV